MLQNWKKIMSRGLSLAIILVLLVTMVPSVFAQDGTAFTVNVDGLLVYEQPNATSKLIAVMSLGSAITTFPNDVQNGFTRVRLPDNRTGWAVLGVAGAPTGAPTTGDGSSGGQGSTGVVVQAQANIRVRSEPSLNGTVLGNIGWGENADLLATDPSGDWYKINYKGLVGWSASAWFITVSGNAGGVGQEGAGGGGGGVAVPGGTVVQAQGNVRLRNEPSLNGDRIGFVPWGGLASLLGYDSTGKWINVNYNGLVGWTAAEWWVLVSGDVVAVIIGQGGGGAAVIPVGVAGGYGDLILFNGPNDNAVAIQVVPNGTPFTIIEGGRPDGFTMIQLPDGKTGFVKLPAVVQGQGGAVPVVVSSTGGSSPAPVVISTSPTGVVLMSLGNLRVRNEASISGDQIASLAWGDQVPAFAISADGEWVLVQAPNGVQGWVAAAWLQVVAGNVNALPVR